MRKQLMTLMAATAMCAAMASTALAAGWQQNATGWWYGTNADNSQWHANGWQWIDGNNDGIAECYYFNAGGYMFSNTTTPDGYTVDANGAWTENGVVKTQQVQTQAQVNAGSAEEDPHGLRALGITDDAAYVLTHTKAEIEEKYGAGTVLNPGGLEIDMDYGLPFYVIYYGDPDRPIRVQTYAYDGNRNIFYPMKDPKGIWKYADGASREETQAKMNEVGFISVKTNAMGDSIGCSADNAFTMHYDSGKYLYVNKYR